MARDTRRWLDMALGGGRVAGLSGSLWLRTRPTEAGADLQVHASNFKDFCTFIQCEWSSGFHPCARCQHTGQPGGRGHPGPEGWPACCEAQAVERGSS